MAPWKAYGHKDLKRKAHIGDAPLMYSLFGVFEHYAYICIEEKPINRLIDKYDDWMDKQLENIGY